MGKYKNQDREPGFEKRELTQKQKRQMYLIIANTLLSLLLYFGVMELRVAVIPAGVLSPAPVFIGQVVCPLYWFAFAGFLCVYLIYNRGFKHKGVTMEMLPDTWTLKEKEDFLADRQRRFEKSKWMLTVIVPLLVTISADAIYLFTWPMIQNLFGIS